MPANSGDVALMVKTKCYETLITFEIRSLSFYFFRNIILLLCGDLYFNDRELDTVSSSDSLGKLHVPFERFLLIEVIPA
jgi:hypothetical protein